MDTHHVKLTFSSTSKKIAYYYSLCTRLLCAVLTGIIITTAFLQEDLWFKKILQEKIEHIVQDIIKTDFSCEVTQINLFTGEITLEAVTGACDTGEQWSFYCPVLLFDFSWSGLMLRSTLEASLLFVQPIIFSEFKNGMPAIEKPIESLINAPPVIPFALVSCGLRQSQVTLYNREFNANFKVHCSSDTFVRENLVKTTVTCSDGLLRVYDHDIFSAMAGTVIVDAPSETESLWAWQAHASMIGEHLTSLNKRCTLQADYKNGTGGFELSNSGKSVWLTANGINYDQATLSADLELAVSLSDIKRSLLPSLSCLDKGVVSGRGQVVFNDQTTMFSGLLKADDLKTSNFTCDQISLMIEGNTRAMEGFLTISNGAGIHGGGSWQWNGRTCHGVLTNSHKFEVGQLFTVDPGDACCKITLDDRWRLKADYAITLGVSQEVDKHKLTGQVDVTKETITCSGLFDDAPYYAHFAKDPENVETSQFGFKSFNYKDGVGTDLFDLHTIAQSNKITGVIDGIVLSALFTRWVGEPVQTEGKIVFNGTLDNSVVCVHTEFKNANIRVPYCHNILQEAGCSLILDIPKRTITIEHMTIKLHKGSVTTLMSTLVFGSDCQLQFAHVPLKFSNCLVTWQKEFFGLLSGVVTGIYKLDGSELLGSLTLDKSHLRSNLLSGQVQNDILTTTMGSLMRYKTDGNFDISFMTKTPIKVKTPFLETKARVKLYLKGTLYHPEISGVLDLQEGTLLFPYRPLYISEARLLLTPQELDDPTIYLRAKNKIKKYNVNMQVSGSLKQPKISFESSPFLEEEQIITLLLAGSEEGLLYLVMPQVITQALENLIFGPAESSSKWQRYLANTLKPLKNIRLVPGSVDPAGKGVHGGLEIDITDKLSASIHQNLSLLEDTKVELDYALSDDISIRGTKDEGGNVGGEVEMRWKF